MWHWTMGAIALVAATGLGLTGCAGVCTTKSEKLAALQRGKSYQETARIIGCPGKMLRTSDSPSGGISIVEWAGPGPDLFTATQVEFVDDKLLYYTTRSKSGF